MSEQQIAEATTQRRIDGLVAHRRPGYALDAEFYQSPTIYQRDLERIFLRSWLYAGHVSEVPEAGDFFLYTLADESIIVALDTEGTINALVNVCRHRGSRVCLSEAGNTRTFVCRYHGWTYGLDGALRSNRYMPKDFDRASFGLKRIRCSVVEGMIFVNFDERAADLQAAARELAKRFAPYRLDGAKVAARRSYPVTANWKLVVENFMECYHCGPAHPEYSRIHSLRAPLAESQELQNAMHERSRAGGIDPEMICATALGAQAPGADVFYNRHALYPGYQTGSQDGKPVAPLLGDLSGYDGGATDAEIGPVSFMLVYADHAVIYHFSPRAPQRTEMVITWLVNKSAREGVDYDVERLTWLWDVTSKADERIITNNQAGINSRFYEPGPYSEMERYTSDFVDWYLATISGRSPQRPWRVCG